MSIVVMNHYLMMMSVEDLSETAESTMRLEGGLGD
jgi:hypothetical protein